MPTYITVENAVITEGVSALNLQLHVYGAPVLQDTSVTVIVAAATDLNLPLAAVLSDYFLTDPTIPLLANAATDYVLSYAIPLAANTLDGLTTTLLQGVNLQFIPADSQNFLMTNDMAVVQTVDSEAAASASPRFSVGNVVVDESAGHAVIQFTLDAPALSDVQIDYTTQDFSATAGSDYTTTAGTLTITAGMASGSIEVPILRDAVGENPEIFTVKFSNPVNAVLGNDSVHVLVQDSATPAVAAPVVNVHDAIASEAQGYIDFVVSLDAPALANVSVVYATISGSGVVAAPAQNGSDFSYASGTLNFAPGEISRTVRVLLIDNATVENEPTRNFELVLSSVTGATEGVLTGVGTIVDNDLATIHVTQNQVPIVTTSTTGDMLVGSEMSDNLTGGSGVDVLVGGLGDDVLDGGAGVDLLEGGSGDDAYIIGTDADVIVEGVGQGIDLVISDASHVLEANVENLTLQDVAGAINATGNELDNQLGGNSNANVLDGGAGIDTLIGGLGDDSYVVDSANDLVVEAAGEGTDNVQASVSYVLSDSVEDLVLTGGAAINGTGSADNNHLTGNGAANVLDGGLGADTLAGGGGNDTYILDVSADVVTEVAGDGIDTEITAANRTLDANVENLTLSGAATTGAGNDLDNVLTGNGLANTLSDAAGNDTLDGGAGIDTLAGGAGDDVYVLDVLADVVNEDAGAGIDTEITAVSRSLDANVENMILTGAATVGNGNDLNNVLTGNALDNTLNGGLGVDTLVGGTGDDTYVLDVRADVVNEAAGAGIDTILTAVSRTLDANVENMTLTGTAIIANGNELNNVLTGNAQNNIFNGAGGVDKLIGGAGNDTYLVDTTTDEIVENVGEGTDTVQSSVAYTLGANLDNLTLTGVLAINASGNELNNIIIGNSAANVLDGGLGIDTLAGGAGNDTYVLDVRADVVNEAAGAGIDTILTAVSRTLDANVENMTLTGTAIIANGNDLNNVLTGNVQNNVLNGAGGLDTLIGGAGNDTYVVDTTTDQIIENAGEGTDTVQSSVSYSLGANLENLVLTGALTINGTGNELANSLTANAGANVLDGGAGIDTLAGGAGDDTYILDVRADVVNEAAGAGIDTEITSVSRSLDANVENLVLVDAATIGNGNDLNNRITGNALANTLNGAGGNDTLDGGTGIDTLSGGLGDDVYVLDARADVVIEAVGGGIDTIQTDVSRTLDANVENMVLTGVATVGNGNELDNRITGNALDNTLNGGLGVDTLAGGAGNDTYVLDVRADVVNEAAGAGIDTILTAVSRTLDANVENMTLTGTAIIGNGNALDNVLSGNALANTLNGAVGNDTLIGGAGNDALTGGLGNDTFVFNTALDAASNVDTITDFAVGDHLQLSAGIFTALTAGGALQAGQFFSGAGLSGSTSAAQGAGVYYDSSSGAMYYDVDGFGGTAAVKFASLTGHPAVVPADILVG